MWKVWISMMVWMLFSMVCFSWLLDSCMFFLFVLVVILFSVVLVLFLGSIGYLLVSVEVFLFDGIGG